MRFRLLRSGDVRFAFVFLHTPPRCDFTCSIITITAYAVHVYAFCAAVRSRCRSRSSVRVAAHVYSSLYLVCSVI